MTSHYFDKLPSLHFSDHTHTTIPCIQSHMHQTLFFTAPCTGDSVLPSAHHNCHVQQHKSQHTPHTPQSNTSNIHSQSSIEFNNFTTMLHPLYTQYSLPHYYCLLHYILFSRVYNFYVRYINTTKRNRFT